MLIKKLIQRLLDSRTTPEEAGHSAMPSASETVLLTQNDAFQSWGNIHQGVAADDGYVNIFARSVNNTTSEMRVLTSGMTFSSAQTVAEKDMACSAPVAKGQTYTIKGVQVKGIKIIFVKTLGAIGGGGYNGFIRRALSCLRPSFNYSLRNFLRISLSGLADKHFHPAGSTSLLPSHSMFRQVTASWDFISRVITLTTRLTYTSVAPADTLSLVPRFQRRQRTATQSLKQSPLRKVAGLLSAVHSLSYGSHQRWEANSNLSTGGALC